MERWLERTWPSNYSQQMCHGKFTHYVCQLTRDPLTYPSWYFTRSVNLAARILGNPYLLFEGL
jgi:hypothetical protein